MVGRRSCRQRLVARDVVRGGGGWWTPDRQKQAFDVLTANGVSERGAIALISRWKNVESSNAGPDSINPSSGAYGIEQGLGSRKPRTNDFIAQLKQAAAETKNREGQGSGRIFDNARDDNEAARGASVHERAEGWNGSTDNFQGATLAGMAEVRRNVERARAAVATRQHLIHLTTGWPGGKGEHSSFGTALAGMHAYRPLGGGTPADHSKHVTVSSAPVITVNGVSATRRQRQARSVRAWIGTPRRSFETCRAPSDDQRRRNEGCRYSRR